MGDGPKTAPAVTVDRLVDRLPRLPVVLYAVKHFETAQLPWIHLISGACLGRKMGNARVPRLPSDARAARACGAPQRGDYGSPPRRPAEKPWWVALRRDSAGS